MGRGGSGIRVLCGKLQKCHVNAVDTHLFHFHKARSLRRASPDVRGSEYRMPCGGVPEWLKGTGCKPVGYAYVGSNPTPSTIFSLFTLLRPSAASLQRGLRQAKRRPAGLAISCGFEVFPSGSRYAGQLRIYG